jgi:hypothetical protein
MLHKVDLTKESEKERKARVCITGKALVTKVVKDKTKYTRKKKHKKATK